MLKAIRGDITKIKDVQASRGLQNRTGKNDQGL